MTRLSRTAAALTVALAVAAGLSGCSDQRLGAAAVVDGKRISTDDLQQATRGYLRIVPGADSAQVQRDVLQRIILSAVIDKVARREGVGVSAGKVAAARDDLIKSTGGRKGLIRALAGQQQPSVLAPAYLDRWFKDQLLFRRITVKLARGGDPTSAVETNKTSTLLSRTARSMDIEVNPRYGRWSLRRGVVALQSGGLSQTAAELNG
jgi:hypothetical protein